LWYQQEKAWYRFHHALDSQIETLALAMVGVVVSGSSALGRIVQARPLPMTRTGKRNDGSAW